MEQLADLYAQLDDADLDRATLLEDIASEMAWVVIHEGETPMRIAHALGAPHAEVEQLLNSVDYSEVD